VWTRGVWKRLRGSAVAKARDGVAVRLLIVPSRQQGRWCAAARLRSCGWILRVLRATLGNLRLFNHRTHRKIFVVDGEIGYNLRSRIADQWLGDGGP